jgi:hypothetical protein
MANVSSELKSKLQRNPRAAVNLIARLQNEPSDYRAALEARGINVRRTFSLIAAIAIECKASAALALAKETWVVSIEEDKSVHTMKPQGRSKSDA